MKLSTILLLIYIITGLVLQYNYIYQLKSLPSPIYGGDYYYQMGSINHIRFGGNPLESSSMKHGLPGYLPLYGFLTAKFCDFFSIATLSCMFYFSLILFVVSSIFWFYLFKVVFKSSLLASIGVVLGNTLIYYPILKYTTFAHQIMLPLFVMSLFLMVQKKDMKFFIFAGLVYGLQALSHVTSFVGATIILSVFIIYEILKSYRKQSFLGVWKYCKSNIKKWFIFFIIAIPIALGYWYKPIFLYHLRMKYDRTHMDVLDFGRMDVQTSFLSNTALNYLFNFNSFEKLILSLLLWIGIVMLYITKEEKTKEFIKIFVLGSLIATFSYFITEPLLKINFIPGYISSFYIWVSSLLIIGYGLFSIKRLIKFNTNYIYIIFLVLLITNAYGFIHITENDKWARVGKQEISEHYKALQRFLIENLSVEDVVLSTKELSFVINSLSGVKLLVNRWAQQNDPYIDLPKRDIDAAIILYGNNTREKLNLIKRYNITYLYWDYYWINSEFQFDKNRVVSFYDPLITFDSLEHRKLLDKHDIKYIPINFWIDPASRNENVRKYKLLLISPENYHAFDHPWKQDIDKYLVEVWNFTDDKKNKIAVLYKIKV